MRNVGLCHPRDFLTHKLTPQCHHDPGIPNRESDQYRLTSTDTSAESHNADIVSSGMAITVSPIGSEMLERFHRPSSPPYGHAGLRNPSLIHSEAGIPVQI